MTTPSSTVARHQDWDEAFASLADTTSRGFIGHRLLDYSRLLDRVWLPGAIAESANSLSKSAEASVTDCILVNTRIRSIRFVPDATTTFHMTPFLNETCTFIQSWRSNDMLLGRTFAVPSHRSFTSILLNSTTASPESLLTGLSSTDILVAPRGGFLDQTVADLFAAAADETFEEDREPDFLRDLASLLRTHSMTAIAAMERVLQKPTINPEVAVEALIWIGDADHDDSRVYRRSLLERLLVSPSSRVRYGAALGLARMDDPASLSALHAAMKREAHQTLVSYFQLVVDQLEATQHCLSSS